MFLFFLVFPDLLLLSSRSSNKTNAPNKNPGVLSSSINYGCFMYLVTLLVW